MDVVAALRGRWAVRRRLLDVRAGTEGEFTGSAWFEPADGGLSWAEQGRLRLGGYDGPAARRLLVVRAGDAGMGRLSDGRPFHPLDLTGAPVEHRCGDDLYRGSYRLLGPGLLDVSWTVVGPDKEQRIDTSYRSSRRSVRARA
jgi:Family of unknown function (DUF6314)